MKPPGAMKIYAGRNCSQRPRGTTPPRGGGGIRAGSGRGSVTATAAKGWMLRPRRGFRGVPDQPLSAERRSGPSGRQSRGNGQRRQATPAPGQVTCEEQVSGAGKPAREPAQSVTTLEDLPQTQELYATPMEYSTAGRSISANRACVPCRGRWNKPSAAPAPERDQNAQPT